MPTESEQTEIATSVGKAQLLSLPVSAAIVVVLAVPYWLLHGGEQLGQISHFFENWPSFLMVIALGVIIHEALHGLTWAISDNGSLKNVKFGFQLKTVTPYAHIAEPIPARTYRLGAAMPLIVLGLIPYLISMTIANGWLLGFSLLFSVAAAGDILLLWLTRHVEPGRLLQDHPSKMGCTVVEMEA